MIARLPSPLSRGGGRGVGGEGWGEAGVAGVNPPITFQATAHISEEARIWSMNAFCFAVACLFVVVFFFPSSPALRTRGECIWLVGCRLLFDAEKNTRKKGLSFKTCLISAEQLCPSITALHV